MEDFIIEDIKLVIPFISLDTCSLNWTFTILNCLSWFCVWKSFFKVLDDLTNGKYRFLNNVLLKVKRPVNSSRNLRQAKFYYKYVDCVSFMLVILALSCMVFNTLCYLILNWISPFSNQFLPCLNWLLYADIFFIYFLYWILKNDVWNTQQLIKQSN